MTDEDELLPTASRSIFLLTVPPKSHKSDQHKYVQLQKIVHQTDTGSGLRIRPIYNLEYHRLFATRVVELENDDAKVAEFHPSKQHHESPEARVLPEDGRTRRPRAYSIDHKRGAHGGKIHCQSTANGICDMTVIGSVSDGVFLFQCADGEAITWRKDKDAVGSVWVLDRAATGPQLSDETGARLPTDLLNKRLSHTEQTLRTSWEFQQPTPPVTKGLSRSRSGLTLASQYTTHFENESQLSGMTDSPRVDDRDWHAQASESQAVEDTILSSLPMPHLRVRHSDAGQPRYSMHQISQQNTRLYRLLLTAMWLIWSSSEIIQVPDTETHDEAGTALADRHSKAGLSRSLEKPDARSDSIASQSGLPRQQQQQQQQQHQQGLKRGKGSGGLMRRIARICGGGGGVAK